MARYLFGMETDVLDAATNQTKPFPSRVLVIADISQKLKAAVDGFNATVSALRAEEIRARGLESETYMAAISEHKLHADASDAIGDFRSAIIAMAENAFSPAGARFRVPLRDVEEACPAASIASFDAVALWKHLEEVYGGTAGEAAKSAYRDAASALRSEFREFRRHGSDEVKVVGGRSVLTVSVYGDSIFHRPFSSDTCRCLRVAAQGLGSVLIWAGLEHEFSVNHALAWFSRAYDTQARSVPERMDITEHVLIVGFKSKVEFRLSPELTAKVRLFLAEF